MVCDGFSIETPFFWSTFTHFPSHSRTTVINKTTVIAPPPVVAPPMGMGMGVGFAPAPVWS